MPLRDLVMDDDDRREMAEKCMIRLLSNVQTAGKFLQFEVIEHFDALEIARDRLSEILDKAEGK